MYSRSSGREVRIPHNYSGNAFNPRSSTPVEDLTRKRTPQSRTENRAMELPPASVAQKEEPLFPDGQECETAETEHNSRIAEAKHSKPSIQSPIGDLGTEEILLIAIALIIFQSGKDTELALILLALLFVG